MAHLVAGVILHSDECGVGMPLRLHACCTRRSVLHVMREEALGESAEGGEEDSSGGDRRCGESVSWSHVVWCTAVCDWFERREGFVCLCVILERTTPGLLPFTADTPRLGRHAPAAASTQHCGCSVVHEPRGCSRVARSACRLTASRAHCGSTPRRSHCVWERIKMRAHD